MSKLYCFTGMPGAGKSTACQIAEDEGYQTVRMGKIVKHRARQEIGSAASEEEIGEWATRARDIFGGEVFAAHTVEEIRNRHLNGVIIIDGLRSPDELKVFKRVFDEVILVLIKTDEDERLRRLRDIDENQEIQSHSDLKRRDERELQWGLRQIIQNDYADIVIENNGSLDDFQNEVLQILKQGDG